MLQVLNGGGARRRLFLATALLACSVFALLFHFRYREEAAFLQPARVTRPQPSTERKFNPNATPVACRGARGGLLDDPKSPDLPQGVSELPGVSFPNSTTGSYEAIGLEKSWMTIDERYGPYGHGEEEEGYRWSKVDWTKVSWGKLQHDCLVANSERFGSVQQLNRQGRFRSVHDEAPPHQPVKTGRQVVVLRTYSSYKYQAEDYWNIRAIITEASLTSNGAYDVILLVDVKDPERGPLLHKDPELYHELLEANIPEEFRDMAVLFHPTVSKEWYAKVEESAPIWQIMQPLQLYAHFYPEYDHYWQIELDTRFTGDVGKMFRAFDEFGKQQPYKQSRERATWAYIPELHGTYNDFSRKINETMKGGATTWGPIIVDNGRQPPVHDAPSQDPHDDDFRLGVGNDADLLLFNNLVDVKRIEKYEDWVFRDWVKGGLVPNPERFLSVPAQARASWELLEAAHRAQNEYGVAVPSEATLPSFALWNGLKVVGLPIPNFQFPSREVHELDLMLNGGDIKERPDGLAYGPARFRAHTAAWFTKPRTWDWWSSLCDSIWAHWRHETPKQKLMDAGDPRHPLTPLERPYFMVEVGGKVYAPGFMMHPRKTNANV